MSSPPIPYFFFVCRSYFRHHPAGEDAGPSSPSVTIDTVVFESFVYRVEAVFGHKAGKKCPPWLPVSLDTFESELGSAAKGSTSMIPDGISPE